MPCLSAIFSKKKKSYISPDLFRKTLISQVNLGTMKCDQKSSV